MSALAEAQRNRPRLRTVLAAYSCVSSPTVLPRSKDSYLSFIGGSERRHTLAWHQGIFVPRESPCVNYSTRDSRCVPTMCLPEACEAVEKVFSRSSRPLPETKNQQFRDGPNGRKRALAQFFNGLLRFGHAIFVRLRQLERHHLSGQTRARFRHRDSNPMGRQIPIAPILIQQAHSQEVATGSRHHSS